MTSKISIALKTLQNVIRHASRTGEVKASEDVKQQRLIICRNCPYYKGDICTVCGCVMGVKAALIAAKCPKDFWRQKMVEQELMGSYYDPHSFSEEKCCGGNKS